MHQIREKIRLIRPAPAPLVEVLHDPRIIRQILEIHRDLTKGELAGTVPISPPPVRVPHPVEATQVSFYEALVVTENLEEADQFPPNPTCSWIAWNSDAKSVGLIFGRA